ncbi:MAG: hypothetical protein WB778_08210 [Thermoplasmata archaeon]
MGARPIRRMLHQDPRGFLVETLRQDDEAVRGDHFVMGYTSVTLPGQFRDVDRWHAHKIQTDRFVVPLGEMILALFDARSDSPTRDRLEVIRMVGVPLGEVAHATRRDLATYLVPIPPGVYHCIGNLSEELFVLQNYPTEFFNPEDEGRVPFVDQIIPALGRSFAWDLVNSRAGGN